VIITTTISTLSNLVCLILLFDDGRDEAYPGIFSFDLDCRLVFVAFRDSAFVPRGFDLLLVLLNPSVLHLIVLGCILATIGSATEHGDKLGLWTRYSSELPGLGGADLVAAVAKFLLVCVASNCLKHNISTVVWLIIVAH